LQVGLTGGIASGKSTVAGMLAQRGALVMDADALAREVVEPGQPALEEIKNEFGDSFIDSKGRLKREQLGELIFSDSDARRRLNVIVHRG